MLWNGHTLMVLFVRILHILNVVHIYFDHVDLLDYLSENIRPIVVEPQNQIFLNVQW